jgi:ribonucleoside-diphosphate reductase alpha chain
MERIAKTGSIKHAEVPEKWQRVFRTANEIAAADHIRMQAAFQDYTDSAISKTTNFAHTATRDDVRTIYEMAYEMKCKGVTVYRDGSRDNQVLSTGATEGAAAARDGKSDVREVGALKGEIAELHNEIERLKKTLFDVESENTQRRAKRARPDVLRGTSIRKETPLGTMFVHITEDDRNQPFEVFINLGKAGGSAMADAEAMGRLISLALRSGIPLMSVIKQLRGISSDRAVGLGPNKVLSVPDAVGLALHDWHQAKLGIQQELLRQASGEYPAFEPVIPVVVPVSGQGGAQAESEEYHADNKSFIGTCPDCGSQLEFAEGCVKCHVCGFSECG